MKAETAPDRPVTGGLAREREHNRKRAALINRAGRIVWRWFPQTYSMAGIINSATHLSEKWEDVWCRVSS